MNSDIDTKVTPTLKLSNKFIQGLSKIGLTLDDIKYFSYYGGNYNEHLKYYKLVTNNDALPVHAEFCICSHEISRNCYISNTKSILVVGSCCIDRFVSKEKRRRTCEKCSDPHRNRIVNRCNDCRKGFCDKCGKSCNEEYKLCYSCFSR